jgi:hypothetical protein
VRRRMIRQGASTWKQDFVAGYAGQQLLSR